ncbi:MAG: exodeoxyribonuclease V subunit alpha [Desulfotignum sp.]|nr:exodeoxyribonuclease V subunit alpha [Desulfotignum sp.]
MIRIDRLYENEVISHLDYYFAVHVSQVFSHDDPLVLTACALASKALADGEICLDLKAVSGTSLVLPKEQDAMIRLPKIDVWTKALRSAPMVGNPVDKNLCRLPLVLDSDGCLYLSRYHDFQNRLIQALAARIRSSPRPVDPDFVRFSLDEWFTEQNPDHTCYQRQAVTKALHHNFTVISGGPGTGKTHITRIIREIIQAHARSLGLKSPRFLSLAPTGRAASRLQDGATIHSVLVPRKNRPGFIHGKDNLLAADVVIIDEASMIDLALMTRLLEAIPLEARVILLGDENQLSPVQAGAVFSDICKADALRQFVVFLAYNFRSQGKTGIEALAGAIRKNDVNEVSRILTKDRYPDIAFEQPRDGYFRVLEAHIKQGYAGFMQRKSLAGSLAALDRFRILCAHNKGEYGTLQINHLCENILRRVFDSGITERLFKQMIMISSNDYARKLFNGDTGVVMEHDGTRIAGFRMQNGTIQKFGCMDLPSHEPAFGVTIHKSQGSEFETVLMVIPDRLSRVTTRQLLYTGVTRARKKVIILGSLAVIREAMALSMKKNAIVSRDLSRELGRTAPDHAMEP